MAKTNPDEALAALEEKGRQAILEARERADLEVSAEDREKAEEIRLRVKLALGSYQGRPVMAAIVVLMITAVVVAVLAEVFMKHGSLKEEITGVAGTVGLLLFYLLIFNEPLYRMLGRVKAEDAWLNTLPFSVRHYFEALGQYHSKSDGGPRFRVTFSEEGRVPAVEELQVLLATLDPKVEVTDSQFRQRDVKFEGRSAQSEELVVLMHQAAPLLMLLHAKYPIWSLEVF